MKKWFNSILNYIKNLWFKYVMSPRQKRKEKQLEKENIKNLKKRFEKDFNISPESVVKMINTDNKHQTSRDYLNEKLVEGRIAMRSSFGYKTPYLFDPEIIDIHNENIDRPSYPSIERIKSNDNDATTNILNHQAGDKTLKLKNKVKRLLMTRG